MRKVILGLAVLVPLAGGGYAGWSWWTVGRFLETTDNAYIQSDISVVSPKIAGYIRDVRVVDNQRIAAGDVLAVIDDADQIAQVTQQEAGVEAQHAAIASIDSRIVLEGALIDQADAGVSAAEADLLRTQQDYDRLTDLRRGDYASKQR